MDEIFEEIITEINEGRCILFLGSGSTVSCESPSGGGLTGAGLSKEMVEFLGEDTSNFSAGLMEASEFIEGYLPQHRNALDQFIYDRLHDLRPTAGHFAITKLGWKAIVTTNYNRVVETAYEAAQSEALTQYSCVAFRTDDELKTQSLGPDQIPLYKPHGCLSIRGNPDAPMVLTPRDYYYSTKKRIHIYDRIQKLAQKFSTLFVGYSLVDYNFNNIYYELQENLRNYLARSYSVIPVAPHKSKYLERVYQKRGIVLIDDKFDTFCVALVDAAGAMTPELQRFLVDALARPNVVQKLGSYASQLPQSIRDDLTARGISVPTPTT
jgi:hypothetical protein